jgi:TolB-like protein/Tfp pilus assembly protein PilF
MIGSAAVWFCPRGTAIESLAVLPFVNASGDPDAEYLSDGITESLINSLSHLPHPKVMSRNSVFRYKGREADAQAMGRDLKVQAVLTGRVVQRGDGLSISAELVDVWDNSHLWGEQYNRRLSEILTTQEEIAKEISERLRLKLTGEEKSRLTRRSTDDTEAYQLYLKGRFFWNQRGQGLVKSVPFFEQALEKDPRYALAHAGLADAYSLLGWYGYAPARDAFPKARTAAEKALAIDDSLAEAHSSLAFIRLYYDWDAASSEIEFKRALELDPGYAPARYWHASWLICTGREEEAIAEDRRAIEIDPLSVFPNTHLGWMLFFGERYDEAVEQLRKSLELNPSMMLAHWLLGQIYAVQSRHDEAIAELTRAVEISENNTWMKGTLGYAYGLAGRRDDARAVLAELKDRSGHEYVRAIPFTLVHLGLGDKDQALEWLEKAYVDHDVMMVLI